MRRAVARLFRTKTFAHGIHPPELKDATSEKPIQQFPFAPLLIVPLSQHIGKPARAIVAAGDEVERGQRIADPDGFLSVAIHAPASGVIRQIALTPTIGGKMEPGFFLQPFPASTQEIVAGTPVDAANATPAQIIEAIQMAGVVGLGGAGYPTHAKLQIPADKRIDTLVINGAECEPYLTTDHRVMLEHAGDIFNGIPYLMKATGAHQAIIAIEANKADAADVLRRALPPGAPIQVRVVPVKYPQGAEKMLITTLLHREIPVGGLPADVHAICVNVGTAAELGKLLPQGAGLQDRVITVSGPAVEKPGNYRIPIGTPLRFILETVGVAADVAMVVMGGPMMGTAASSLDIPITKGSTGVIALADPALKRRSERKQYPCIHCGHCVDACPIFLNPSQLGLLADAGQHQQMADQHHLFDCFECGCCTYVCPAHIPLAQQFRLAKAAVRKSRRVTA
jgi:electron transport complex protein RnfC